MHFVQSPSITPTDGSTTDGSAAPSVIPPAKLRLIERLRENWLFALGAGSLGLVVLCGLW
jgi:hypothetical protein